MKIAYWPPLILLFIGGALYFNGRLLQKQPPKIPPTPTTSQQEVPAKNKKETGQEQPSPTQQALPVKDKTEAKVYRLF